MKTKKQKRTLCTLFLCSASLLACSNADHNNNADSRDTALLNTSGVQTSGNLTFANSEGETGQSTSAIKVGEIICFVTGRFSDSGRKDTAYVIKIKQGTGNPAEDGTADEYAVRFTGSKQTINIGCCDARLINEGDLNKEGRDELSVFQYPENGNTCRFQTYTLIHDKWKELIEPFLIPAAGAPVSDSELQTKVTAGHDTIYYCNMVDSNETFVAVKTKAILK